MRHGGGVWMCVRVWPLEDSNARRWVSFREVIYRCLCEGTLGAREVTRGRHGGNARGSNHWESRLVFGRHGRRAATPTTTTVRGGVYSVATERRRKRVYLCHDPRTQSLEPTTGTITRTTHRIRFSLQVQRHRAASAMMTPSMEA